MSLFTSINGHPSDPVKAVFIYYREALFAQIILVDISPPHLGLIKDHFDAGADHGIAESSIAA
jgi:hypothetical protein